MKSGRPTHLREYMDDPNVTRQDLLRELGYIRWVNHSLGGTRVVVDHLKDWASAGLLPTGPITILDVATGSADIPKAVLNWAKNIGRRVQIVGVDLHPITLDIAREWTSGTEYLSFIRADALRLPLADNSVDIATCSMFLHHLSDEDALAVLREMLRVSRSGLIVNDLVRTTWARAAIYVLTLFSDPLSRHDARLSVAKGWTVQETLAWRDSLKAPWLDCHLHRFARFTLAGLKPAQHSKALLFPRDPESFHQPG